MRNNDYKKLCQYNITRYLDSCYQNGVEPSLELMENVDFGEISSKDVVYNSSNGERLNLKVDESLAKNCITTLPFEAYEKFITADWINYTKEHDSSLVNVAISYRNLPLLERLHDLGFKRAMTDSEYSHGFVRDCLQRILHVGNALNGYDRHNPITDENYAIGYLNLVKKSVCELDFFYQMNFSGEKKKPLKYLKNPDWTQSAADRYSYNSYRNTYEQSINQLLTTLAPQTGTNPIFQDALVHLMKKHPKDIKKHLGLESIDKSNKNRDDGEELDNILSVSLRGKNLLAAKMIVDTFGLSQQDCLTAYEKNIQYDLSRLKFYNENAVESLLKNHFNTHYLLIKQEFFPDLETEYLPLFVLGKDEALKSSLVEHKDDIFNRPLFNSETICLNDCLFLAKTLSLACEVFAQDNKELSIRDARDCNNRKNLYLHIAEYIFKHETEMLNNLDFKSMQDNHWQHVDNHMSHLAHILQIKENNKKQSVNAEELKVVFETAKLHGQLNTPQENRTKTNKMKI